MRRCLLSPPLTKVKNLPKVLFIVKLNGGYILKVLLLDLSNLFVYYESIYCYDK